MTDEDWALIQHLNASQKLRPLSDDQVWDLISDLYRRLNPSVADALLGSLKVSKPDRVTLEAYAVNLTALASRQQMISLFQTTLD